MEDLPRKKSKNKEKKIKSWLHAETYATIVVFFTS